MFAIQHIFDHMECSQLHHFFIILSEDSFGILTVISSETMIKVITMKNEHNFIAYKLRPYMDGVREHVTYMKDIQKTYDLLCKLLRLSLTITRLLSAVKSFKNILKRHLLLFQIQNFFLHRF